MSTMVPVISTAILQPFIQFFNEAGVPLDRYLHRARIPYHFIDGSSRFIPTESLWSFVCDIEKHEHMHDLGLEVALAAGPDCMHPNHRKVLAEAPTLLAGLKKSVASLNHQSSGSFIRVDLRENELVRVSHHGTFDEEHPAHDTMSMFALVGILEIARVYLGHDWQPDEIGSSNRKAKDLLATALPDARFCRHHSCVYIEFERKFLDTEPIVNAQGAIEGSLLTGPETVPNNFREAVALLLDCHLPGQPPKIQAFAELLRIPVRSLQRQLEASGTSYRNEVMASRYRLAKRLLLEDDDPVELIATKLGYRHATHFIHFFSNIAGVTPLQFRKRHSTKRDSAYPNRKNFCRPSRAN